MASTNATSDEDESIYSRIIDLRKGREEMGMKANTIMNVYLLFDGSTAGGNPGVGGCGAVCGVLNANGTPAKPFAVAGAQLGLVTSNVAEYYGLIIGLRRILQEYPMLVFDLTILGDSELVIKQMTEKNKVRSSNLIPLCHVVTGLVQRIKGRVLFTHIPREKNKQADSVAKKAAAAPPFNGHYLMFYPSLTNLLYGKMKGRQILVGHDCGAAAMTPEVLFDATTILEVFGRSALKTLKSPGKTTQVRGQSNFTILGILSFPVTFTVKVAENDIIELQIPDVVVVDFLPYDVQLSFDHPLVEKVRRGINTGYGVCFNVSNVPTRFQAHPYWRKNTTVPYHRQH